jgi:molybdopterin-binding protein
MNRIEGKIVDIKKFGHFYSLLFRHKEEFLRIVTLEIPPWVYAGKKAFAVFKETEVILCQDYEGGISVENKIRGKFILRESGDLFSEIVIDSGLGMIKSISTVSSVKEWLNEIEQPIVAIIPSLAISLSEFEEHL